MSFLNNFSLEGKIALVTGASYGIGFAIASAYAEAGATIVFNDIKQELVDKGLAAYAEKGIKAHGYVCDVTNEEQVNAFIKKVEEEVGVIDILVNNAGIIKRIPMCDMSAAEFRQVIDVDLNAPFIVSKAVIPSMIKKGHGKIINICSMMSELGRETVSASAAVKAFTCASGKGNRTHRRCHPHQSGCPPHLQHEPESDAADPGRTFPCRSLLSY